jgi:hypothetical protein
MPRQSKKQRFITVLESLFSRRIKHRAIPTTDDEEDGIEDAKDVAVAMAVWNGRSGRFLFRGSKNWKGCDLFEPDLEDRVIQRSSTKSFYRNIVCRVIPLVNFWVRMVNIQCLTTPTEQEEDDRHQWPILKFIATFGTGGLNANQSYTFHIGYGTADKCRRRVNKAILSLRNKYYYWLDAEERDRTSKEILFCIDSHTCWC